MILGNNEEKSATVPLINSALKGLSSRNFELSHNFPFKGGNITRHFGRPQEDIHALQLEMTKDLYMDDIELEYDPQRADRIRKMLHYTFELLIECLIQ